nr:RNA-directed DNA polymerase, eukaryota, reverse transcriptase zinc-binding domain protein [Tanacetum cinerariifolium]
WSGEVLLMGDFNEVRLEEERYGSIFNSLGASAFNSFIVDSGLVETPSGGLSFTRSHRSATKMNGFDSFISDTWCNINIIEPNVMFKMAKKLKILKGHIRVWVKDKRASASNLKKGLKKKLSNIDSLIDKGKVSSAILEDRLNTMNKLASLENMELSELAQKAKVKWSIEGDENSKFFHGIINKRRNNLAIRGIMVDRDWKEDPAAVKKEFFSHFKNRFEASCTTQLFMDMEFPNRLSTVHFKYYCYHSNFGVFFYASGLRINLQKSKLIGVAVENSLVTFAANNIGCMTLSLLFSYLGVNVGGHMSRIASWDVIINKVLSRLSKWKLKVLSVGGRLTLLKSVLGSTPIYYMSLFKAPVQVINKLEAIRSHFFHGVDTSIRKMMLVKWNDVLASKEMGGLGVSSFYALNRTLIFKWVWRFRTQGNSIWTKVIKALHGEEGNGENTMLWDELWKGEVLFKNIFPRLYALELVKNISVTDKMAQPSLEYSFRRNIRGGAGLVAFSLGGTYSS